MALVFGRDAVCSRCAGRGWTAPRNGNGLDRRPAYPSELRDHATGKRGHIDPCRSCGASGLVHYRIEA